MNNSREPQDVLSQVPGWEAAAVSQLDGGLTNHTWLIADGERKAVLKIDESIRDEPFNTRPAEARIQARAAERGLAPRVLYYDEQALMTEFVEGVVWEPGCLDRDDNIELVAGTLRRLHAMPLTGRSFDSIVAARRYVAKIDNHDRALVTHCTRVIKSMRQPHNLCCCHNDLVAENIVTAPEMIFLDWEYACDNDPFFDLATIVEHHELGEDKAFRLLDAYFDGDGRRWRRKLLEQQELYLALYWLWLASRPESARDELEAAAARIRG
ncbi:MAG: phosphotransferase family protein [Gammaproteobacteria bacterium]|nr:phosphotransferase family protein [Gammaproteobacteria bacterium]